MISVFKENWKIVVIILFVFTACRAERQTDGPYFGNGFHNGCADQNSIVIWTRLTKITERNISGKKFIIPQTEELRELDKNADPAEIREAQIPEGSTLEQMEGACPGASGEVKLTYYPLNRQKDLKTSEWIPVDTAKNFIQHWKLEGLLPDTKYVVKLEAREDSKSQISDMIEGSFRTAPQADSAREVDFCIVTCHDYIRRDTFEGHKIYDAMLRILPDFYVHTGDIEYYDMPEPYAMTEELMRFKWDRLFALPLQRRFWTQITSYWMKDDHDVLKDDAYPGKTYGNVSWKRGLGIFEEQTPSCEKPYQTVRWGKDLQIWLTEGRNYRSKNSDPDGPGKTIFGAVQKEWLFSTLQESDATFKVIINANPILGPDRTNKKDNYSNTNFQYEGDEIRDFINRFDNVFLCNGDRHWQYVTHFEGTNLWEFSCGAGSDKHAGGWSKDDIRPQHRFLRVKGGFLHGKIKHEDGTPVLTFQHYDVDGNVVHEEIFRTGD